LTEIDASAFELLPVGVALVAPDHRIVSANKSLLHMLEGRGGELLGLRLDDLVSHAALGSALDELISGGRDELSIDATLARGMRPELGVRVLVTRAPAGTSAPSVACVAVFVRDEERRIAERALRGSLALQQATFDASGDGFLVTDADEAALTCNRQMMTMWRLDPLNAASWEHMLRMPAITTQLVDPDAFLSDLDALRETPDATFFRRLELTDGRVFELQATPRIADGKNLGRVFSFRDMTERVRAQAELLASREALLQAQKMDAVGRLAGGVAHDFNNLLTVITSYVHFLRKGSTRGIKTEDALDEIASAAHRAAELTRQLLAFSRKQVLVARVLDLNELVTELVRMLRRLLGDDIELEMHLAEDLGRVRADRAQLDQVVMNLVVNGRDAMPNGGRLSITTRNEDVVPGSGGAPLEAKPGPYVSVAVSDEGSGMDEATLLRVFDPFFTTKEAGRGTGLGLATVDGVVNQSGGFMVVRSAPGQGSTFCMFLPRVDAAVERVSAVNLSNPLEGSERILLVEDSLPVRKIAQTALEHYGYTVVVPGDTSEACRWFERAPSDFDVVVTDIVMPKMDGRTLAETLRRIRPELRVLFVSGYTETAVVHPSERDDRTAFLAKPFTPEGLARSVRRLLSGG
jgi:two-component system cell cycle sensor histidine kinase/response regulator CckA